LTQPEVCVHSVRDHLFSKGIAIPHILFVIGYSVVFVNIIRVDDPPQFIDVIYWVANIGLTMFVIFWYMICYCKAFDSFVSKFFGNEKEDLPCKDNSV
jgi:hypothetical protein